MPERRASIRAQNDAADALLTACVVSTLPQSSFRQAVNVATALPIPTDFNALLGAIDEADERLKGGTNARRH